jgi:hypothetical protein
LFNVIAYPPPVHLGFAYTGNPTGGGRPVDPADIDILGLCGAGSKVYESVCFILVQNITSLTAVGFYNVNV